MEPFDKLKIEVKSQSITLADALLDQLKNFRSNIQNIAMEIQADDLMMFVPRGVN